MKWELAVNKIPAQLVVVYLINTLREQRSGLQHV